MTDRESQGFSLKRAAPFLLLIAGAVTLFLFGRDHLSFATLRDNREALLAWRDAHYVLAALSYVALYAVATALSFPGGLALTLTGGFLFGAFIGAAYAVTGATIGAAAIFLAAKAGVSDFLREKAGPYVSRVKDEFRENETSFMLFMRLVPIIPFFAANLVPAFLGAATRSFVWTTAVGIVPGAVVYASVGAGLGKVFARGETPDFGVIFEPHILLPLLGLSALALLPVAARKWRARARKV